jgi:hypothetical protein
VWKHKHGHTKREEGRRLTISQNHFSVWGASGQLIQYMDIEWVSGGMEEINTCYQKFLKMKGTKLKI